jgi:carbonic anhydrase
VSVIDELLRNNEAYVAGFAPTGLSPRPTRKLTIVTCMDARFDLFRALGLELGDAHVLRNAGGVVTDDTIRSLAISQRLLGTEEVMLVHHTDCGMLMIRDDDFRNAILEDVGIRPPWAAEAFSDLDADVRQSIARVEASPFLPHVGRVRGFVYETETGRVREVA